MMKEVYAKGTPDRGWTMKGSSLAGNFCVHFDFDWMNLPTRNGHSNFKQLSQPIPITS
jgi:hypothetical protein